MIERLTRLHIDGDRTVYPALAKEWERRGERWCGGVNEPPPILHLEALKEWADVEFFEDGLTASIVERDITHKPTVQLREIDGRRPLDLAGVCFLSADGRPKFRIFYAWDDSSTDRSNFDDFCSSWHVARTVDGTLQLIKACWARESHVWDVDQYPLDLCTVTPPHQDQQPTPAEVL
jgi:hypothetical protein